MNKALQQTFKVKGWLTNCYFEILDNLFVITHGNKVYMILSNVIKEIY